MKSKGDEALTSTLFNLCQQHLSREPSTHLVSMIVRSSLLLQASQLNQSDLLPLEILLTLKSTAITLIGSPHPITSHITAMLITSLKHSNTIQTLQVHKCPDLQYKGQELAISLSKNRSLREIVMTDCQLGDTFFQQITPSLKCNSNLNLINFSHNQLNEIGVSVSEILSQHNTYRKERAELAKIRGEEVVELEKEGLLELNFENNRIDDFNASRIAKCLKEDKWIRCLNLNMNCIGAEAVKEFIEAAYRNKSILSLDVRNNPGFSIESSNLIFKRLVNNINAFKQLKSQEGKEGKDTKNNEAHCGDGKYSTNIDKNCNDDNSGCEQCHKIGVRMSQSEKRLQDLQIENRKLKRLLQNRGFEISVINPSSHTEEISFSNRNVMANDNSEDLVQRIDTMMNQLTKILEGAEVQHQTQIDISNPLSTTHNMSNTVQILAPNHHSLSVPLPEEDELSEIQ